MLKNILFLFIIFMIIACSNKTTTQINYIICFGDSLTEGIGASNGQTYPYFLQKLTKIPVINKGVRGNTSTDGLNRADDILEYKNAIVLIEFGANDYFQQIPLEETKKNIEQIINKLNVEGNNIILVSTEDNQLNSLYRMLQSLAKEKKYYIHKRNFK